jgi:gas vesicle protein
VANEDEFSRGSYSYSGSQEKDINGLTGKGAKVAADVREGISNFVDGVKEKMSGDAVRKVSEAAGKVKDQVRGYVEDRGIGGLADDVTDTIRRYPVSAMLCGILIGVLIARPRGD